MKKIKGISFFCPAYYDAENIANVVNKAASVFSELCEDYEIVVINDGSPDNTRQALEELLRVHGKLKVINHPKNLGYPEALREGFKHASRFDFVLFTDGDNQYDVGYFRDMVRFMDNYDAVITYRTKNGNNLARRVISWMFNRVLNVMFGEPFRDLSSAFRLVKRSALDGINLRSTSIFLPVEIVLKLHRKKARIKEIPLETRKRMHGRSTSLLPRNFIGLVIDMLRIRVKDF